MKRYLLAAIALLIFHAQGGATAQQFPTPAKPIRLVVAIASGAPPDLIARALAPKVSAELGVPVLVENKPGAGFILGTMEVVRAAPDGHTLLVTAGGSFTTLPHTVAKLPYDPSRDLTPVIYLNRAPLVLVASAAAPFDSYASFVSYAKANPNKLNFGTQAVNSGFDVAFEQLKRSTGIDVPIIPHKGTTEVVQGLMSGEIQLGLLGAGQALSLHKGRKLRALAAVEDMRIPILPDIPTLNELGNTAVTVRGGVHLFGPGRMSSGTVQRINAAFQNALKNAEVEEVCRTLGYPIVGGSTEQQVSILRREYEVWGQLVSALGIKPQ